MTPSAIYGWLLAALLVVFCWYGYVRIDALETERDVALAQLQAAQKRITSIQAQVQKSTTASQKARQDVKEKLDAAPAFRDTAVPVPVRDSLCERIRCK